MAGPIADALRERRGVTRGERRRSRGAWRSARDGVGGNCGTIEINAREGMRRDASMHGMTLMNADERERASIHAAVVAGLENGSLRPIVRTELPLAEAPRAHQMVMELGAFGK